MVVMVPPSRSLFGGARLGMVVVVAVVVTGCRGGGGWSSTLWYQAIVHAGVPAAARGQSSSLAELNIFPCASP